jgi:hypothetical protein
MGSAPVTLLTLNTPSADVTRRGNAPTLDPSVDRILGELFLSCIGSKPVVRYLDSKGLAKDVNSLSA